MDDLLEPQLIRTKEVAQILKTDARSALAILNKLAKQKKISKYSIGHKLVLWDKDEIYTCLLTDNDK